MKKFIISITTTLFFLLCCSIFLLRCSKERTIKIGCISPFTGDGAVYGEALKRGFAIYLDDLKNNAPEVFKRIKIIYEDDKLDAKEGVNIIRKLIEVDKVQVIIGAFTSNVTLAIAPIAEQSKVVLLTPTATNYKIKDAGDYIFRVTPSDAFQGKTMADFVCNNLKKFTAAILYMNTDYGVGLRDVFQEQFVKNAGKITNVESFEMGARDMRTQLQKIKSQKPDIIFLPSNYVEATNVLNQAKELGIHSQFVGTDGIFDQKFLSLTKGSSDGMYVSTMAWGSKKYRVQAEQFRLKFKTKFREEPGVYSALCYDALAVVIEAVKNNSYQGTNIKDKLYNTEYIGATGLNKFDKNGEVEKDFDVYQVNGNQFMKVEQK